MVKKNKTVKELNVEFEMFSERIQKLEEKSSKNISDTISKPNGIEDILKVYDDKIEELEKILKAGNQNQEVITANVLKCKNCEKHFVKKDELKEHLKTIHPKDFKCDQCGEVFDNSWKLELHLNIHNKVKPFKCEMCGKDFYFKWRMEKHKSDHSQLRKCCHYYNNNKACPYEEVGCRFEHKDSIRCIFDRTCYFKLCQYKHSENIVNNDEYQNKNEEEKDSEDNASDKNDSEENVNDGEMLRDESDLENEDSEDEEDSEIELIYQQFLENHKKREIECANKVSEEKESIPEYLRDFKFVLT